MSTTIRMCSILLSYSLSRSHSLFFSVALFLFLFDFLSHFSSFPLWIFLFKLSSTFHSSFPSILSLLSLPLSPFLTSHCYLFSWLITLSAHFLDTQNTHLHYQPSCPVYLYGRFRIYSQRTRENHQHYNEQKRIISTHTIHNYTVYIIPESGTWFDLISLLCCVFFFGGFFFILLL